MIPQFYEISNLAFTKLFLNLQSSKVVIEMTYSGHESHISKFWPLLTLVLDPKQPFLPTENDQDRNFES